MSVVAERGGATSAEMALLWGALTLLILAVIQVVAAVLRGSARDQCRTGRPAIRSLLSTASVTDSARRDAEGFLARTAGTALTDITSRARSIDGDLLRVRVSGRRCRSCRGCRSGSTGKQRVVWKGRPREVRWTPRNGVAARRSKRQSSRSGIGLLIMFAVAGGRLVTAEAAVDQSARAAARAASLQREPVRAVAAASGRAESVWPARTCAVAPSTSPSTPAASRDRSGCRHR